MTKVTPAQNEQTPFQRGSLAHLKGEQFAAGIEVVVEAALEIIQAGGSDAEIEQATKQAARAYLAEIEGGAA